MKTSARTETSAGAILLRKLGGLGRDESGVAFVVTLAFVLPMLIFVTLSAGISDMARRKIRLQNSVDMAARSAAVVQADLLSKMAVVNRVTAWTYANYCRRRMDYLLGAFCQRCIIEWDAKSAECASLSASMGRPFPNTVYSNWAVGDGGGLGDIMPGHSHFRLDFRHRGNCRTDDYNRLCFRSFLNVHPPFRSSLDAALMSSIAYEANPAQLEFEIAQDHMILEGTSMTSRRLLDDYRTEIKKAAEDILQANFLRRGQNSWGDYYWTVQMNTDTDKVFRKLGWTAEDERCLFEMAGLDPYWKHSYSGRDVLGAGADVWFVRDQTADHPKRVYREGDKFLQAEFDWAWYAWGTVDPTHATDVIFPLRPTHRFEDMNWGTVTVKGSQLPAVSWSENGILYNDAPVSAYVLKDDFWTRLGAITVAARWNLPNPFSNMAPDDRDRSVQRQKALDASFWSVLNPKVGDSSRPAFAMAVASARAGYKRPRRGDTRRGRIESTRYCLHYTPDAGEQRWNLCETDWDGLLIPVAAARSRWESPYDTCVVHAVTGMLSLLFEDPLWHKNESAYPMSSTVSHMSLRLPGPCMGSNSKGGNELQWDLLGRHVIH